MPTDFRCQMLYSPRALVVGHSRVLESWDNCQLAITKWSSLCSRSSTMEFWAHNSRNLIWQLAAAAAAAAAACYCWCCFFRVPCCCWYKPPPISSILSFESGCRPTTLNLRSRLLNPRSSIVPVHCHEYVLSCPIGGSGCCSDQLPVFCFGWNRFSTAEYWPHCWPSRKTCEEVWVLPKCKTENRSRQVPSYGAGPPQ